jgi:hypothetical protein
MEGACAHFHIVRLQQCAALRIPVVLQAKDNFLKGKHISGHGKKITRHFTGVYRGAKGQAAQYLAQAGGERPFSPARWPQRAR